jgi:hypothetical protein
MINIPEMILMGAVATLFMDYIAILLGEFGIIRQHIKPGVVGRWILYMLKGQFTHEDINKAQEMKIEKSMTFLSHYVIGIALAGIYLFLEGIVPAIRNQLWLPILFGISTVILPWLWMYPSFGLGFIASKTSNKSDYIITSLVNHTNFGLGLLIWIAFFRRFLM